MDPVNAPAKFKVCTSPVPEITAIGVLVGIVNRNLGEEEVVEVADGTIFERALMTSYRPSIVTFLYLNAFQRYCRFYAPARHFSPPHLKSPPNFSTFLWE